jgi:hypothetical protein
MYLDSKRLEVVLIAKLPHAATHSQESFRWHASSVHASSADNISLDDCRLQSLLATDCKRRQPGIESIQVSINEMRRHSKRRSQNLGGQQGAGSDRTFSTA